MSVLSIGMLTPVAFAIAAEPEDVSDEAQVVDMKLLANEVKAPVRETVQRIERRAEERRERRRDRRQEAPADDGAAVESGPGDDVLASIRICESGGDYTADTGNGFYGAYQFTQGTWAAVGGSGNPAQASPQEQDMRAATLYAQSGPGQWPVCGS